MSSSDICANFRPRTFNEVLGHKTIVSSLRAAVLNQNRSHLYLFSGDNGLGKTTLARILGSALNCDYVQENGDPCGNCESCISIQSLNSQTYIEIDASDANGINEVRSLKSDLSTKSLFGRNKVIVLDECHGLTSPAQKALLKVCEDMPSSAYILLCTTEPNKLDKGLLDRAESYHLNRISPAELNSYLKLIIATFSLEAPQKVLEAIISQAQGKPRRALKALQKAINVGLDNIEAVKEILDFDEDVNKESLDLYKALLNRSIKWGQLISLYKKVGGEPEAIRLSLAGLFRYNLEKASEVNIDLFAEALGYFLKPLPYPKPENALVYSLYEVFCMIRRG